MAVKRKSSPAPPPQAHSSDEYSSSDEEEEEVAPVVSSQAKTPQAAKPPQQRTEVDDDEYETETESDSDPEPPQPAKPTIVPQKPSEYEEEGSSDEEDEDEEEKPKVEKPVPPPKKTESEPEKKRQKVSEPDQSEQSKSEKSKLSAPFPARVWSNEDEMALLRALSEYQAKNGKVPAPKDYASFLSTIGGSIGFPVTEKQLSNKIRMMKHNYSKKKEKGTDVKISKPHDKAVFDIATKLFNDSVKVSKKEGKVGGSSDKNTNNIGVAGVTEANVRVANKGVSHTANGAANGESLVRSNFYFRSFIEEKMRDKELPSWLTVEDVVTLLGESTVQKMNAKIKDMRIEAMRLNAKEDSINVELFTALSEAMVED